MLKAEPVSRCMSHSQGKHYLYKLSDSPPNWKLTWSLGAGEGAGSRTPRHWLRTQCLQYSGFVYSNNKYMCTMCSR